MSVHMIYYKDGAKMMRPVLTREEYLGLRNGGEQKHLVAAIRSGNEGLKSKLLQMNYSCLPNEDGSLKGSKRMSTTVRLKTSDGALHDVINIADSSLVIRST
ncbi:MAG: hypothetical protein IJS48_05145 [Prevotella sp.]|nr:hypothetical protein [Prevotella sp.]